VSTIYDRIGTDYTGTRSSDARIAAFLHDALGDARSVLNVGAGTGAYEPTDREVLAVEPSATMIAQRPRGAAPAVRARAEQLPLAARSFDAGLAVNTLHHWTDLRAGLAELRRVTRDRVVVFVRDPARGEPFWLTRDYLPALDPARAMAAVVSAVHAAFPTAQVRSYPLPCDCADGLFVAYWGRPERYLVPEVRRNISNFALADPRSLDEGLARLRADLASGAWDRTYGALRDREALDLGHCALIAELG